MDEKARQIPEIPESIVKPWAPYRMPRYSLAHPLVLTMIRTMYKESYWHATLIDLWPRTERSPNSVQLNHCWLLRGFAGALAIRTFSRELYC